MIVSADLSYLTHHSATLEEVHLLSDFLARIVDILTDYDTICDPRIRELAILASGRTSVSQARIKRGQRQAT